MMKIYQRELGCITLSCSLFYYFNQENCLSRFGIRTLDSLRNEFLVNSTGPPEKSLKEKFTWKMTDESLNPNKSWKALKRNLTNNFKHFLNTNFENQIFFY